MSEKSGFFSKFLSVFSLFLKKIGQLPVFHKKDAAYDDGYGSTMVFGDNSGVAKMNWIMAAYGSVAGFFACQYSKYLHQRAVCRAWNIPLTSRPVESYSVVTIVVDMITFFGLYFAALGLGGILAAILKMLFGNSVEDIDGAVKISYAYGFAALVIVSVIFYFVRFNIFLIGVD